VYFGIKESNFLSKSLTIAIDGTAAAGKSTVAALLSRELNYLYLDTGVMYRAVTWAALDRQIEVTNEVAVSALAEKLKISVAPVEVDDGRQYTVLVDGQDVTWEIRTPKVETHVSLVSSYSGVRAALTVQQRQMAEKGSIIMVGRDIGTVVLPKADLKIFMQASAEERARRRCKELDEQNKPVDYEEILAAIQERDKQDKEKPISPLVPADDAVFIETDGLTIEDVLAKLRLLVSKSK
jgi:cytidylate kinase